MNMKNNKKLKAVIFDLSGTIIDFGSLATITAMKKIFQLKGINLTSEIINKDMGIKKKLHITKILKIPSIKLMWLDKYKKPVTQAEFNDMCYRFDKELIIAVKKNLNLIPNVKNIIKLLKKNNIKIGVTTGYPKKITKIILDFLKKKNINIDSCVSDDEVKKGRPNSDMCVKNFKKLKINSPKNCLKVDDSFSGIMEGKNARMLTVGLVCTGIQMGLSQNEYKKINKFKLNNIIKSIRKNFKYYINENFINYYFLSRYAGKTPRFIKFSKLGY